MQRASRPDAIIVGAGIVGAACAYYLSLEGIRCLVIDSGFAGGGTTSAGMGHLAVMDDSDAEFELCSTSCRLWAELAEEMPADCEVTSEGCLWVAETEAEMEFIHPKVDYYRQRGVHVEALGAAELAAAEPELAADLPGALLLPEDRILYQLRATRWLLDAAERQGSELREHQPVRTIGPRHAVLEDGSVIEADVVINAAGVHAARLTPGLDIEPRKGHLVITDRYPGFCRRQVMELGYQASAHTMTPESVAFNVQPRATGQLLIGSSRELVGWDQSLNRAMLARMLRRAFRFLPRLEQLSCLRSWTGLRPATPDKLPYIGRWPDTEGLWIAAGHEGLGIMTATGTGRLITDLLLERQPLIDPTPFDPGRLPVRGDAS